MNYLIKKAKGPVSLDAAWDSNDWKSAETTEVKIFREDRGGDHRPVTCCKMQYDATGIYGLFQVQDKYVRSVATNFQGCVCRDSCVEFFVEPPSKAGYLNFEFNCGGTMLVYHVVDNTRTEKGFKEYYPLTVEDAEGIRIFHTMPKVVDPEIQESAVWRLGFFIPFAVFKRTTGLKEDISSGQVWRANFYKCGDHTSHPHWASWQPLTATNFHLPECFGKIVFE